ncbi:hypothetical protein [Priestia megaterium]|uniref:hypothetical protein n=1 Tax=Priestia megaterium TaxID=1404 RepID=UPI00204236E5|nr:hypothetical protein [Priestia megaterium]MCM3197179.1 hypothetical protein [Priestia megaterium]
MVTFRSVFTFGAPLLSADLPTDATYAFASNENVVVSGTLQVLNLLGIVVPTIPFLAGLNGGNPNNVEVVFDDTIIAAALLGGTIRITINATVTAPSNPLNTGRYLGELTVRTVI